MIKVPFVNNLPRSSSRFNVDRDINKVMPYDSIMHVIKDNSMLICS